MEHLFPSNVPDHTSVESPEHDTAEHLATPSYPPPDRACYVCGQRTWVWNPGTQCHLTQINSYL